MLSIHQVAQIRAVHEPNTYWVRITFSDKSHEALTLYVYIDRAEGDDFSASSAFAESLTQAINALPGLAMTKESTQ